MTNISQDGIGGDALYIVKLLIAVLVQMYICFGYYVICYWTRLI